MYSGGYSLIFQMRLQPPSLTLMTEAVSSCEIPVNIYQTIKEDSFLYACFHGNLKSQIMLPFFIE